MRSGWRQESEYRLPALLRRLIANLVPESHGVMDLGHVVEVAGVGDFQALHSVGMPATEVRIWVACHH